MASTATQNKPDDARATTSAQKPPSSGFARSIDALDVGDLTPYELVRRIAIVYLKPQWKILSISLASMVFLAATTGALPFLMRQVADRIFIAKDSSMLYILPGLVLVIMGLRAIADYIGRVTQARIANEVVGGLRQHMFGSLVRADLSFLDAMHSGRFVAAFMADVGLVNSAAAGTLTALVKSGLTAFFLVLAMFWMDSVLALLVIMGAPGAIYFMGKQRKKIRKSTKGMLRETGDLSAILSQTLRSVRIVKAYSQEGQEEARFSASVRRIINHLMKQARASSAMGPATEALTGVGFALAIFYGGWQGIEGNVTMGSFMGFMTAAMLAYQPLKALAGLQGKLTQGTEAAKRVFALIDHQPTVDEIETAEPLLVSDGEIIFENVSFAYNKDVPVVRNFSFTIPAGKKIALVGASGSGKTTLINLLMRFFDPDEGRILIDGQDVRTSKLSTVRGATALLTQDPILFDDTIMENIRYGSEGKSDEEIMLAAHGAAADEFITELPEQYDTQVGEAGGLLSGGQRQRIAIARAMLKGAPILLLDEPTSALDSKSESKVQAALETLFAGRTVLMIAHRLSTVKNADIICVLDKGQLVESGTHDELFALDGLYADFCKMQMVNPIEASPSPASDLAQ